MRHIKLDLLEVLVPLCDRLSLEGEVYELAKVGCRDLQVGVFAEVAKDLNQLHPMP